MPRAKCRCGQSLKVPKDGTERIVCPQCGAKVRVVVRERETAGVGGVAGAGDGGDEDGFLRFPCPCGRRLKVLSNPRPTHGKCPDCGRVVPVPRTSVKRKPAAETPTAELGPEDASALQRWVESHRAKVRQPAPPALSDPGAGTGSDHPVVPTFRAEAGLRVCPGCGKPVHMGSDVCRACGTAVPKR